jgi:hypothetical protein
MQDRFTSMMDAWTWNTFFAISNPITLTRRRSQFSEFFRQLTACLYGNGVASAAAPVANNTTNHKCVLSQ